MILQELGQKMKTDKSGHTYKGLTYLDIYDRHFNNIRENVKNFVEIGVLNGCSLKMWKEYFPNATIWGIDIDPRCRIFTEDRINILIGDQNDDNFLEIIKKKIPSIDILLDDGSHITSHQIKTFENLQPLISEKGYYVVEDLRNSYEEYLNHHDIRKIWPGMSYNNPTDELKNYRSDFNKWIESHVKRLDFSDEDSRICGIHHYSMVVMFEHF